MIFKNRIFITLTALCAPTLFAMQAPNELSMRLAKAAYEGKLEEVKNLIAEGADPNALTRICQRRDNYDGLGVNELLELAKLGRTLYPLVWAIEGNHEEICKYLLDHGADPNNDRNPDQRTPLTWAAEEQNDNPHLCLLLLRYGADIKKRAVLIWAAGKGNKKIVEFLIQNGATHEALALGSAATNGHHELCKFFITRGIDVNERLPWTRPTPFFMAIQYAVQFGWYDSVAPKVIKLLNMFIAAGANVNDQDGQGNTPLMLAADSWFLPEELLLEAGADSRIKNNTGDTALMICARRKSDNPNKDQHDLWPIITNSIFNPVFTDAQIQESRERILTALLVFKRVCPTRIPRDLCQYLLHTVDELKQDSLISGAFGIREHLAALVPLQTVRSLINSGKWNKARAIAFIKKHHYTCIKPLMAEALLEAQAANNTPEMQALLNPETAESMYDGHIERNIKRRLGARSMLEWANDAVRTPTAYAPGSCVVQ